MKADNMKIECELNMLKSKQRKELLQAIVDKIK